MSGSQDSVGDLLPEFYGTFGMPDEGPPPDFNVTDTLEYHWRQAEIDVLRTALRDGVARKQLSDCRELLDDLATRLTSEELLRELRGIPLPVGRRAEELFSGVFWFAIAGSLDKREGAVPVTPLDGRVDLPFPLKVQMIVQGSLVLRLYIALVYMREGVLAELIAASARAGGPCSNRLKKLLNLDFVRRIRNALSQGSFSPCLACLVFRDEKGAVVATPGFLSWLCTWLMLIQLQALAAPRQRRESPKEVQPKATGRPAPTEARLCYSVYTEVGWNSNGTPAKTRRTGGSTVLVFGKRQRFLAIPSRLHFRTSTIRYPSSDF